MQLARIIATLTTAAAIATCVAGVKPLQEHLHHRALLDNIHTALNPRAYNRALYAYCTSKYIRRDFKNVPPAEVYFHFRIEWVPLKDAIHTSCNDACNLTTTPEFKDSKAEFLRDTAYGLVIPLGR